ncbi:MAG: hypothetical protein JJU05_15585 [Verrucomicrobia bacterium]|nr:hypothetical protein [Verrucomicrobiota bacterium]MCH8527315.1 hypothetical protein [Kiritimatiellia bacterium]
MTYLSRASLLVYITLVLNARIQAQSVQQEPNAETGAVEASPEPVVAFHFAVYVWPASGLLTENSALAGVPRMFYHSPEGIRQVPAGRNVTSPLMPYRGPMPLELFDGKWVEVPPPADAPPDTEPARRFEKTPVAKIEIPPDWRQALLVVFPGQTGPGGSLRVLPLRYDVESVRPDFIRIHNTTGVALMLEAEGQAFNLPQNGILDFQARNRGGHHTFRANFYAVDDQGEPQLRYTTRMVDIEGRSNLYLLYQPDSMRFRLQRVGGHEPPPAPTPPPSPEPPGQNPGR